LQVLVLKLSSIATTNPAILSERRESLP
jgi:hypothetical protein